MYIAVNIGVLRCWIRGLAHTHRHTHTLRHTYAHAAGVHASGPHVIHYAEPHCSLKDVTVQHKEVGPLGRAFLLVDNTKHSGEELNVYSRPNTRTLVM